VFILPEIRDALLRENSPAPLLQLGEGYTLGALH